MSTPLHALLVEDSADDAALLVKELQRGDYAVNYERVETAETLKAALGRTSWDMVFCDFKLPHLCGNTALEIVKESGLDLPFIYVSGTIGEDVAVGTMKAGAHDYVMKNNLARLPAAVARELREARIRKQNRQAEQLLALRTSALEAAANAVLITQRDGSIQWVNPAFTTLTGYSAGEAIGQNPRLLKSGRHETAFYADLWQTILAGQVWHGEMINRRKDGRLYPEEMTITPVKDLSGEVTHFIAIKQDITERKRAEEAMRESENKYRHLFESLGDAAFLVERRTRRIIDTNKQAELLLELTRGEILGRSFDSPQQLEALGKVLDQFINSAGTGKIATLDTGIPQQDATVTPVQVGLTAVTLHGRELVLALVRDVTERKQLEEQFRHAQKMEAIGQLAGGVAHDFNNLLAVIRGNAELMLMEVAQPGSETSEFLKQIIAATERATNLTRQLLAFGRKQVMQSQLLNLNDVIGNLTKMLNRLIGEDIQLRSDCAPGLPSVLADVGMLEQVLLNLVVNARDAMPKGGQLVITTQKFTVDAAYARAHPEARVGEFISLSVSDTGTGIAPEHLTHIFEPFYTTKEPGKGTGLGLATVHGIVKQHQGWIEVNTRLGAGTTFRILLPAVESPTASMASEPVAAAPRGGTERILLIEDDYALRLVTRRVLESAGYHVEEASSGATALQTWNGGAGAIDLLLTDIVMPDGLTGPELADQLRAQSPDLKVIFISGYSSEVTGKDTEFLRRTKCCFLQKPFASGALLQTVRTCLDENQPALSHSSTGPG